MSQLPFPVPCWGTSCIASAKTGAARWLAKVHQALTPGGTLAIAEFLVDEARATQTNGLTFAVNMLVNTEDGDTYRFSEIAGWLKEAGFENVRMMEAPGPVPLILANRAQ